MRDKKIGAFLFVLSMFFLTIIQPVVYVQAAVYEGSLFDGSETAVGTLYVADGAELSRDGSIVFGETSNKKTRVSCKKKIETVESDVLNTDVIFTAEYDLQIEFIKDRFGFMFGLPSSLSYPEVDGSAYVYVDGKNGFSVGLSLSGKTVDLKENKTLNKGDFVMFKIIFKRNGDLEVFVNKELVYNGNTAINSEGFIGFGQTDNSIVKVSNISVKALMNNAPENYSYIETFDDETFNTKIFSTTGKGKNMEIKDGKIVCEEMYSFMIETQEEYANNEFVFDICDMQRQSEKSNGKYNKLINSDVNVSFGYSYDNSNTKNTVRIQFVAVDGSSIARGKATKVNVFIDGSIDPIRTEILPTKYNIWNADVVKGKTCNFKIRVIDGQLSVYIKYNDEVGYYNILTETLDFTPQGVVRLYGNGGKGSTPNRTEIYNLSIDNVGVCNLDYKANILDTVYQSSKFNRPDDYVFEDTWDKGDLLG